MAAAVLLMAAGISGAQSVGRVVAEGVTRLLVVRKRRITRYALQSALRATRYALCRVTARHQLGRWVESASKLLASGRAAINRRLVHQVWALVQS